MVIDDGIERMKGSLIRVADNLPISRFEPMLSSENNANETIACLQMRQIQPIHQFA
jgi:hypothetical protein